MSGEKRVSRRQTLFAMVAAAGIVQIPTAAIVVAIPAIHMEFGTSIEVLQWTVAAFLIPFSALMIASGRTADVFGRRRSLVGGATILVRARRWQRWRRTPRCCSWASR